jgi:hypothetical protein
VIQDCFMSVVHHIGAFLSITARRTVRVMRLWSSETNGLGFPMDDGQEVPSPPQVVAFPFDEPAGGFTGLFRSFDCCSRIQPSLEIA